MYMIIFPKIDEKRVRFPLIGNGVPNIDKK